MKGARSTAFQKTRTGLPASWARPPWSSPRGDVVFVRLGPSPGDYNDYLNEVVGANRGFNPRVSIARAQTSPIASIVSSTCS